MMPTYDDLLRCAKWLLMDSQDQAEDFLATEQGMQVTLKELHRQLQEI